MEYSKLVAVTGLPGLYELINSKNDGAIVRSIEDGSTRFASSRIHQFSHLESIEVYTVRDNVNLVEVFQAMEKTGGNLPDARDNGQLKAYFQKAFPDLDFERVYTSDLKKMVKWFELLQRKNVELKLTEPVAEEPAAEEAPAEPVAEKKAETKKPAKKAAPKKKDEVEKEVEEEKAEKKKPAKKAAPKKKEEEKEEKPAKKKK